MPHWWSGPRRGATVVVLDTHLDLQFIRGERIERLRSATDRSAVAALAKPHPLMPDRTTAGVFSYGIEDFLYGAGQMGLVDRVIWVAPPHVLQGDHGDAIAQLCQLDGVTMSDLLSLRLTDPARPDGPIRGRLLGLDLTIAGIDDLRAMDLPDDPIVDIDIDYCVEVPGDRVHCDPRAVAARLRDRFPDVTRWTISRSVSSGFMPPWWAGLAERFLERSTVMHDSTDHQTIEALAASGQADGEMEPLLAATAPLARQFSVDAAAVGGMAAAARSDMPRPWTGHLPHLRELEAAAIGLLWCHLEQLPAAMACYQTVAAGLGPHGELALEIGRRLLAAGAIDDAQRYLQDARVDDKTVASAELLLASVAMRRGQWDDALRWTEAAAARTPAWDWPLQKQRDVAAVLGMTERVDELADRLREHKIAMNQIMRSNDSRR